MRNITQDIRKAIATQVLWGVNDIYDFAEVAERSGFKMSFWEEGENWAYIGNEYLSLGYIWRKHPLILLSATHKEELEKLFINFDYAVPIYVSSLTTEELMIDFDQQIIERLDGALPYDQPISAQDIWFYSVT